MPTPGDMTGKAAIVTGAASGLGRATALQLAAAGADLCVVDINTQALDKVADEVRGLGVRALVQAVDLSDTSRCAGVVNACVMTFGRLDALCNVAAVFLPDHSHEVDDARWDRTLAVNLSAPFKMIRAAIPHLLDTRGAVVNVTSCAAIMGQAYLAAYSATKAALNQLTRSLAMEYMHRQIRFNAVAPGGMLTPLAMGLRDLKDPDPTLLGRISPLRGVVEIDDVAEMVAFLATDAARGYHGACISIDNGVSAG